LRHQFDGQYLDGELFASEAEHRARQHRQEITGCKQRAEHLHGVTSGHALWNVQTAGAESIVEKRARRCVGSRQNPRLVDQFGQSDLAAFDPPARCPRHHALRFVEQDFRAQILLRAEQPPDNEIDRALAQAAIERGSSEAWVMFTESRGYRR
jgi:hypothetical protein